MEITDLYFPDLSYISDSHIIGEFFFFTLICVKSFELVVFIDSECDFICFGFYFIVWKSVVLKISITLSLENRPKPMVFQPFRSVSVENFTNRNIRFRLAIPIQTDWNRTEHTPTLYPLIFQDSSATSDYRKFWNYTWNSAISREMTQPMLLLALQA